MGKKKQEAAVEAPEGKKDKKKGGGWKAALEEEERAAKAEQERLFAIKNKIKFVRARHILHEDEGIIRDIRGKLLEVFPDGKPSEEEFGKYAIEFSQCPSNVKGGLLGYFGKGQMDPNFEEVAFKTPVGSMSDVIQSQSGYHVLMVVETK